MHKPTHELSGPHRTGVLIARGALVLAGALAISLLGGSVGRARAADIATPVGVEAAARQLQTMGRELDSVRGELAVARVQLERASTVMDYSAQYAIPADVAGSIYDIALSEGIEPVIAFRLVKVESNFNPRARSGANAYGYTQIQPATARFYEPGIQPAALYDRETNLRLGFRFLKDLLRRYDSNMKLALLAYNRGPGRVAEILAQGGDPANGYEQAVMKNLGPRGATN